MMSTTGIIFTCNFFPVDECFTKVGPKANFVIGNKYCIAWLQSCLFEAIVLGKCKFYFKVKFLKIGLKRIIFFVLEPFLNNNNKKVSRPKYTRRLAKFCWRNS